MGDKPIIFSAPMARALLDGRKSQTRRVLKPQPVPCLSWSEPPAGTYPSDKGWSRIPYAVGDRLYVRETCKQIPDSKPGGYFVPGSPFYGVEWFYRADGNCPLWADGKWRPSIHMPRWASRLTLTVTDVRVQRLQEISDEDAQAEGMAPLMNPEPVEAFRTLWNSLHGPDAWDANPWVVAVSFSVQHGNIDLIGGTHD